MVWTIIRNSRKNDTIASFSGVFAPGLNVTIRHPFDTFDGHGEAPPRVSWRPHFRRQKEALLGSLLWG